MEPDRDGIHTPIENESVIRIGGYFKSNDPISSEQSKIEEVPLRGDLETSAITYETTGTTRIDKGIRELLFRGKAGPEHLDCYFKKLENHDIIEGIYEGKYVQDFVDWAEVPRDGRNITLELILEKFPQLPQPQQTRQD